MAPKKFNTRPSNRRSEQGKEDDENVSKVSRAEEDNPAEDSGDDQGNSEKHNGDKNGDKKKTTKPKVTKTSKVDWKQPENDRKLLLIMVTDPEKVKGEKNLQVVANSFRQKPTCKSIQVRISTLRELGQEAVAQLGATDPSLPPRPRSAPPGTSRNPNSPNFGGFGVRGEDLPENLRNNVDGNVERDQQRQDWEDSQSAIAEMHRRNYAAQQARDAAQTLVDIANVSGEDSDNEEAPSPPPTTEADLEAAGKMVVLLTGAQTHTQQTPPPPPQQQEEDEGEDEDEGDEEVAEVDPLSDSNEE